MRRDPRQEAAATPLRQYIIELMLLVEVSGDAGECRKQIVFLNLGPRWEILLPGCVTA